MLFIRINFCYEKFSVRNVSIFRKITWLDPSTDMGNLIRTLIVLWQSGIGCPCLYTKCILGWTCSKIFKFRKQPKNGSSSVRTTYTGNITWNPWIFKWNYPNFSQWQSGPINMICYGWFNNISCFIYISYYMYPKCQALKYTDFFKSA